MKLSSFIAVCDITRSNESFAECMRQNGPKYFANNQFLRNEICQDFQHEVTNHEKRQIDPMEFRNS